MSAITFVVLWLAEVCAGLTIATMSVCLRRRLERKGWLLFFGSNEAAPVPFKGSRHVGVFGVSLTPRGPEVVQGGVVLVPVFVTWLRLEYVTCRQPVVDCLFKAGYLTDI